MCAVWLRDAGLPKWTLGKDRASGPVVQGVCQDEGAAAQAEVCELLRDVEPASGLELRVGAHSKLGFRH